MRSTVALAVLAAVIALPPAAVARAGHHRSAGPAAGMNRADYVKADAARAERAAARRFDRIDTAHHGVIDRESYIRYYRARSTRLAGRRFDRIDANHDGVLEPAEVAAWHAAHRRRARAARSVAH